MIMIILIPEIEKILFPISDNFSPVSVVKLAIHPCITGRLNKNRFFHQPAGRGDFGFDYPEERA